VVGRGPRSRQPPPFALLLLPLLLPPLLPLLPPLPSSPRRAKRIESCFNFR
jgi:hypothetical protein